jgi:hypothetical protein
MRAGARIAASETTDTDDEREGHQCSFSTKGAASPGPARTRAQARLKEEPSLLYPGGGHPDLPGMLRQLAHFDEPVGRRGYASKTRPRYQRIPSRPSRPVRNRGGGASRYAASFADALIRDPRIRCGRILVNQTLMTVTSSNVEKSAS